MHAYLFASKSGAGFNKINFHSEIVKKKMMTHLRNEILLLLLLLLYA